MTTLDRLHIEGIRSFGVNEEQAADLKFQCPLTLILGHNGCGKTTIIECLKYAACGDQPPNSRVGNTGGSNFVHFPRSLKLTEVLAQVKLRIRDINGRRSVVTRSMRNTQKLKKVEFKSLDSTICIATKDGPGEAISSRCIDVDQQMSYLLGVSKAILNYVVFCHQEESCWPMEEGKKLKERFDEIFDSAKYNKCMESIRKLKKTRNANVLSMRKDVQLLEVVKCEAEEKMAKLEEEQTRMEKTNETVAKCQSEIADIERQLDTLRKKEINIASLVAEKTQNDFKLEELKKTIKEIKTSLRGREFAGNDQQLEMEIKSFVADFSKKKDELKKLEDDMKKMGEAEKHVQSQLNDEQNSLGGLKRDVDTNKEAIQTRTALLNRLAGDLQLQEMVSPYSEAQVGAVVENVERKLREMKRVVETVKVENDDEEMKLQGKIDELREEKAKLEQSVTAKKAQLKDYKSELERVSCDINEVAQSTKTLRVLENKLERNNKELQELLDSVNCAELDKEIRELQRNRERSDEKLFELNKEVDDLIEVTNLRTTLDSCVDRKVACEEELERLYAFRGETLKHVLEVDELPAQNLNQHLDKAISKLAHEMRTTQEEINRKREKLVTLQSDGRHLEEKLRKANQQLSADVNEMVDVCGSESYEEVFNRVTEALKTSQDETGMLKASDYFYREYIRKLREPDPCCPLCKRGFEEEDVGSDLANELEERLRHVPAKLNTSEEERDRYAEKLARLQQLKPVNERITLLKDKEIPSMGQACRALLEQISKVKEEITELEMSSFYPCRSRESKGRTVQPDAIAIDQKRSDLASLQREIEELQSQIPTTGKTLQQARNERDQLQFEIENTRKKIEANQAKKINHNERVNKLQNEKNEIVKQQLKVQTGQQQEKQLLDKQAELKESSRTLEKEIVSTSSQVLPIQQKLEEAIRDKEEMRKKHRKQMEAENNKSFGYEQRFEEVHKLQNKIEQFERHGVAGKLEKTERNVARMKRDLEAFGAQRSSFQTKQDGIKADLCSRDTRHRDLLDNKKLREKKEDEEKLQQTMKEMEDRLGVLDYDAIKEQLRQLKQQSDVLNSKKHYAEGRQKELALSVSSLRNEMERPMNKNAVKNYKDKVIDLQVEEAANRDIDSYYSTLDWALKHFHTEKMKSINTIIKELWCNIYRGIDIDYIEIKCDDVEVSSADKKRTYNYRVVQVKDDVELDMRGRCSAGQKMLASIIIRLALAEVFSNHCGIMTLDEPTTNLDRDNIESLSVALVDIVKAQTKHKKFQLVVITHDEDFLLRLTRVEKANYFWKVYKDAEGLSRVELCSVR